MPLNRGDCILTEKPFVYVLKSKYRKEKCDECLKGGEVLKCSVCQYVYYCDRVCQTKAWPIHKIECGFLKKVGQRELPDAARVMSKIILKLKNGGDFEKSFYTEKSSRKFRDLMSHYAELKTDKRRVEHMESLRAVITSMLGNHLVPNPIEMLGIYGRLITNGFNILDMEMNSIATGIYLGVSVTDHSCLPNAVATFEGTTLKIHVIEDMPSLDWSKIFISYIDTLNTTNDRRKDLEENYYFLCNCPKCLNSQELNEMCAAACLNTGCSDYLNIDEEKCNKCKTKITDEHRKNYWDVMDLTKIHIENMKEIAYLDVCKVCLKKQDNILHPLNVWHVKTLDSAFEAAIAVQKWTEALEFGNQLLPGFRKYYGEYNPLLGLLYMKIGKIQLFLNLIKEALHNLKESRRIIEITYGVRHSIIRDHLNPLLMQAQMELTMQ